MELSRAEQKALDRARDGRLDPGPSIMRLVVGLFAAVGLLFVATSFNDIFLNDRPPARFTEGIGFLLIAQFLYHWHVATSLVRKLDERLRDARHPV